MKELRTVTTDWIEIIEDIQATDNLEEINKLLSVLVYSITETSRRVNVPFPEEAA